MRLVKMICPSCDGTLDMKVADNATFVYCPFCGNKYYLDSEKKEYTYNEKINIYKDINVNKYNHQHYTDDAEVIRAKGEVEKEARGHKSAMIALVIVFLVFALIASGFSFSAILNERRGKISAGSHENLIGLDYKTVEAHFRSAGFTNIELIDLNDSGIAFWTEGKVETISIGGETTFYSTDYFDPDIKVVISYH